MVPPSPQPASRYRRRILGVGALLTGALYVIGAPIFVDRIEDDLDQRVPAELDAAGYEGITASFSGQDGVLTCRAPLDDPERARAAAYDVWGVRAIELDRSCRVNPAPAATDGDASDDADAESADETSGSGTETVAVPVPPSTEGESELATVHDIVSAHPDLAFLAVLLADADIGRSAEPVTLFAPNNSAFDAVPADVLGQLQNDPALLEQMLSHHAVSGAIRTTDMTDGELEALDGTALTVVVDATITVGGATIVDGDIIASNGVVHVVDSVIMPAESEPEQQAAEAAATYDGSSITLTGAVAGDAERDILIAAAVDAVGDSFVVDELTVDAATGVDQPTATALAPMIGAMPADLLSGVVGFDGTALFADGIVATDDAAASFTAVAAEADVEPTLASPPEASGAAADELEVQLNEFVAENPILFEPSSAVLEPSAFEVIDRVATDALALTGVALTVEGHTDSDGIAIENLQLSQNRAEAVRDALVERGLTQVDAVGLGSEQPVLVDGVEDKTASRRVEFRVVPTP